MFSYRELDEGKNEGANKGSVLVAVDIRGLLWYVHKTDEQVSLFTRMIFKVAFFIFLSSRWRAEILA